MSIIQDALKKIDRPARPAPVIEPPPVAEATLPPSPPPPAPVREPSPVFSGTLPPPVSRQTTRRVPPQLLLIGGLGGAAVIVCGLLLWLVIAKPFAAPEGPAGAPSAGPLSPVAQAAASHQETIYRTVEPAAQPDVAPAPVEAPLPPPVVQAAPPDLLLNGIMYLETGPRAIINNAIVGEGDMIGGATVTSINKKSVILTYNNVEITLNLK